MSPFAPDTLLLLEALAAIVGLVVLVSALRVHPFIALTLAAGFVGLVSGMPIDKVIAAFQEGFGGVLGFVGVVLGLGTMLGKLMAESGGAAQIAQTLVRACGPRRVHWAMMLGAFLVGIPLFFEVGFVLLVPLVFLVARESGLSVVKIGIPLLAGLSVVHGLVPPHPGPLLAIGLFNADIGLTIFYGLIVGLPTAILAGPVFGVLVARVVPGRTSAAADAQLSRNPLAATPPSFTVTVATILLPVALMLLKSYADVRFPPAHTARVWMDFVGNPITALLVSLLVGMYTFGHARGFSATQVLKLLEASVAPVAGILLIIGAGGGFKQMLVASGVGAAIGQQALNAEVSPLVLAWLVAAVIRVATGSATVATITGAGLVAPLVALSPGVNRELLVLATGAGSLILSHVNDAGFWLVKQYFDLSVAETLATWTVMETLISVVALGLILGLSLVV